MQEPTYEYVKGRGWVVAPLCDVSPVYLLASGERYRFEFRKPKPGEYYDAASVGSRWASSPMDWDSWGRSYKVYRLINLCTWDESWRFASDDIYVTVVLLDE